MALTFSIRACILKSTNPLFFVPPSFKVGAHDLEIQTSWGLPSFQIGTAYSSFWFFFFFSWAVFFFFFLKLGFPFPLYFHSWLYPDTIVGWCLERLAFVTNALELFSPKALLLSVEQISTFEGKKPSFAEQVLNYCLKSCCCPSQPCKQFKGLKASAPERCLFGQQEVTNSSGSRTAQVLPAHWRRPPPLSRGRVAAVDGSREGTGLESPATQVSFPSPTSILIAFSDPESCSAEGLSLCLHCFSSPPPPFSWSLILKETQILIKTMES